MLGAAAITAGAGLLGGVVGNVVNAKNAKKQHKYNMELARYQNQQNVQMWRMQNEYNSPTSQMDRLNRAGLNPHLVYGNGVTGNQAGSAPSVEIPQYQAAKVDTSFVGESAQSFFATMAMQQGIELQKSQIDKNNTETLLKATTEQIQQLKLLKESHLTQYYPEIALAIADRLKNTATYTGNQAEMSSIDLKNKYKLNDAQVNKVIAESTISQNKAKASQYMADLAELQKRALEGTIQLRDLESIQKRYNINLSKYGVNNATGEIGNILKAMVQIGTLVMGKNGGDLGDNAYY